MKTLNEVISVNLSITRQQMIREHLWEIFSKSITFTVTRNVSNTLEGLLHWWGWGWGM